MGYNFKKTEKFQSEKFTGSKGNGHSLGQQVSPTSTKTSARKKVSCLVKRLPKWRWE